MGESVLLLTAGGIEALARADAAELCRLADAAGKARRPAAAADRLEALARLRAFGSLLAKTRRNLHLLRGTYRRPGCYGPQN